jgi:hypothetical protein
LLEVKFVVFICNKSWYVLFCASFPSATETVGPVGIASFVSINAFREDGMTLTINSLSEIQLKGRPKFAFNLSS